MAASGLGDPFDFAYTLLCQANRDPKGDCSQSICDSTGESSVSLKMPVPVHLVYYTAWPTKTG